MIAVYGTPCGGTGWFASVLTGVGLDVGHERLGPDGFVCGWAALGLRKIQPHTLDLAHEWRLMRDPLATLETLPGYADRVLWADPDPMRTALEWWVRTHEAKAHLPALRLWRLADDWPRFIGPILGHVPPLPDGRRKNKPKRFARPTWADLHHLSPTLTDRALRILEQS